MGKLFGFGAFGLAMLAGLFLAPIALGLAMTHTGETACAAEGNGSGKSYLVGDSIGVGMKPHLEGFTVNAEVSRQLPAGIAAVKADQAEIKRSDVVVIELGTNKSTNFAKDAEELVKLIRSPDYNPNATVYWVQVFSNGDYNAENNAIEAAVGKDKVIETKKENIPLTDGIHPTSEGYKKLADLIQAKAKEGPGGNEEADPAGDNCDDDTPDGSEHSGECSANGIAFGLPSSSVEDREAVFGKANSPAAQRPVTFFGNSFQAHEKVVPCLEAVEREIKANGDDNYKVRSIGGYHPRPGDPLYFFHMYGGAVDINPDTNPMCDCTTHGIPDSWVKAFQNHGFFWGGNFRTTKDWMHFEWHGEKP